MTLRLAVDAAGLLGAVPLLVLLVPAAAARRAAARRAELAALGPGRRRPRPRRAAAGTSRRRCSSRRWCCCWSALARPEATVAEAAPGGHGDPRLRRLGQHGRHRPGADPDRGREGRGPRVRAASSRRRSGSASSRSASSGAGHRRSRPPTGPPCSPRSTGSTPQGGTALARGLQTSLSAIVGRPVQLGESTRGRSSRRARTSATTARPRSILLLRRREHRRPGPARRSPTLASSAGVRVYPIGLGSAGGHGAGDRRLPGRDRAGRAAAARDRRDHRRRVLRRRRRAGAGRRSTTRSSWRGRCEPSADRGDRRCSPRRPRCCCWPAPGCPWPGSGGWSDDGASPGRSRCCRCSPCRCCVGRLRVAASGAGAGRRCATPASR